MAKIMKLIPFLVVFINVYIKFRIQIREIQIRIRIWQKILDSYGSGSTTQVGSVPVLHYT
jgi:hypothetical protein